MKQFYTLKELQDYTSVYSGFKTINDCNIEPYYKGIFPKFCSCGGEMIMTEPEHTQLQCCNPACFIKLGYRLAYFCSSLGYKGFGEQNALSLFSAIKDKLQYGSPMEAFLLSNEEICRILPDSYAQTFIEIKEDVISRPLNIVDAVSALGIQGVGSRSAIFKIIKSRQMLLGFACSAGMNSLCDISGIQAPMIRHNLNEAVIDILLLLKYVALNIQDTPKGELFVAITGKVSVNGQDYTRSDFVSLCEDIKDSNGAPLYKLNQTKAESKLQYVIADSPSSSDKYSLGERLGILITAQDFYNMLLNNSKEGEKSDE